MSGDWVALKHHVKAGRAKLRMSQRQLAAAAGVVYSTVQSIERATPHSRIPDSMPAIEVALGWPPGRAEQIVYGTPQTAEVPPHDVPAEYTRAFLDELHLSGIIDDRQFNNALQALESRKHHEV